MERKGCITELMSNESEKSYIGQYEPEILTHLELVLSALSIEEVVE